MCICDIVRLLVMVLFLSVSMSLSPCHAFRVGEVTGHSSRVHAYCLKLVLLLRSRGRFPWWGDLLIPRYQGPPGRLSRGAGRPMGPSTPPCSFSKLCCFCPGPLNQPQELKSEDVKVVALGIFVSGLSALQALARVWFSCLVFCLGVPLGGWGASSRRLCF